jgi:glutamyl-tRNA reductase
VRHLFRVTAGLDSVVLGEAQIVSQVATSLRHSVAVHAASPLLKLAFKSAVRAGERARRAVWGRLQAASLGSAAIDAAAQISNGLNGRNVVVIGAGEIADLALRSLVKHAPAHITVANRSLDAAMAVATVHGAEVCLLEYLPTLLHDADVVIAATRAPMPLIDRTTVADALRDRSSRPLTFVDVSLPRNVDVAVRQVSGARLVGIDELGEYVAAAQGERHAMTPLVERIIDEEIASLRLHIDGRERGVQRKDVESAVPVAV